jgi:hypothetical protein
LLGLVYDESIRTNEKEKQGKVNDKCHPGDIGNRGKRNKLKQFFTKY